MNDCLPYMEGVPEHLRGGLERYLLHGIRPGDFLSAVLENNLVEAFKHGDEEALAGLRGLVSWLYNHAPSTAWGSPARVEAWAEERLMALAKPRET